MASERIRKAASIAGGTIALTAIVFAAAQVSVALIVQRSYRDFAERTRELEAFTASSALTEHFQTVYDHADIVSGYSFPEYFQGKRSYESMRRLLDETRKTVSGGLAVLYMDASGRVLIESAGELARARRDAIAAGFGAARAAVDSARPAPRIVGSVGPLFECYFPVMSDGRLEGLLCAVIDAGPAISKYVAPFETRKGHDAFLAGEDGLVLWSSAPGAAGRRFAAAAGAAFSERRLAFGDYGLRLIVSDDRASIMSMIDAREMPRAFMIALIASLAAAAASLTARLVRSESRRRSLDEAKRRLSEAVRSRDFELVESEIRYRALFDGASDAILLLDEDGIILRCNDRALPALGQEPRDLLGKTPVDISPPVQPDGTTSAELAARTIRYALDHPSETVSFLWRGVAKGGSERDFEVDLSVIETGGVRYLQSILRDVTERRQQMKDLRQALEQREILLHELHHRVKNNLQFIVSLLELQRGFEPEEAQRALRRAQGRVSSLAEAYLAAAEVPETLIVEAPAFFGTVVRIARGEAAVSGVWLDAAIECEDLRLSLDAAVSLGLILRELVDNVGRHAYPVGSGGALEVSLSRDGGSSARLAVRDRGRGLAGDRKDGLGLTMARALAAQLSGELEIVDAWPGVSATLRFPIP
jgi:PAS domain S-box-containing protein